MVSSTTPEGRKRHNLYLDYETGWSVKELLDWCGEAIALGATRDSVVRYRARGTLGPTGFAGLEVTLPLPSGSTDAKQPGGDSHGETP